MNILFYTTYEVSPMKGGTERITATLATRLQKERHIKCYSVYSAPIDDNFERTYFVESMRISSSSHLEENLYDFIKRNDIDIIVNQGAFELASIFRRVLDRFSGKKLITAHHFNPGAEEHFFNLHNTLWRIRTRQGSLKNFVKLLLYPCLKYKKRIELRRAYKEAYECSDRIVLLSENFREEFKKYARLEETSKVCSIHNALSFDTFFDMDKYASKKKIALIVARLDEVQKRISLALRVWQQIESNPNLKDWNLKIVGHGVEYEQEYIDFVNKHGLKRVEFCGAQKPISYYQEASVFLFTSLFEGWGLTLTEAQQMGVVPLAFNSYASLTDIITNAENGYSIPECDLDKYVHGLEKLMMDDDRRKEMAAKAIESSKRFAIDKICQQWVSLFDGLNN